QAASRPGASHRSQDVQSFGGLSRFGDSYDPRRPVHGSFVAIRATIGPDLPGLFVRCYSAVLSTTWISSGPTSVCSGSTRRIRSSVVIMVPSPSTTAGGEMLDG